MCGNNNPTDRNPDTRRGEYITGFYVRSGFWVDGIAIMTSLGRKSAVFGNANGGSGSVESIRGSLLSVRLTL